MGERKSKRRSCDKVPERAADNSRWMVIGALTILGLILGSGILVYNYDSVYLSQRPDLALSLQSGALVEEQTSTFLVVASDHDGNLLANQDVEVTLETPVGNVKTKGTTDSNGVIMPQLDIPDYDGQATVVIKSEHSELRRDVTIFSKEEAPVNVGGMRILLSTDKPIYHPTWEDDDPQMLRIRALCLKGNAPFEGNVELDIQDPNGEVVLRENRTTGEWGVADWEWKVTDQHTLGTYTLIATAQGKEARTTVQIKEYVLPRFKIEFRDVKSWYTLDDTIQGTLACNYFFGKPVQGTARVVVYDYLGVQVARYDETFEIDEVGEVPLDIPMGDYSIGIPNNKDNGVMFLNVTITDTSGHSENSELPLTVARSPIMLSAITDTNVVGLESTYYIIAQTPDGSVMDGVELTVDLDIDTVSAVTDSRGLAEVSFVYKDGMDHMNVKASKGDMEASEYFYMKAGSGLKVIADEHVVPMGDEARFSVHYTGDSYTRIVYYDVINSGIPVTNGIVMLEGGTAELNVPVSDTWVGTSLMRVWKIQADESVLKDSIAITVEPTTGMAVDITTNDEYYNPGEDVALKVKVTDGGEPVMAALGMAIVDESVFELGGRMEGGFEDLFFALEERAMEPSYMIWDYVFSGGAVMPLPEKKEIPLSNPDYTGGVTLMITSNSLANEDDSQREMEELKTGYWGVVLGGTFMVFVGLLIYGSYKRPGMALGLMALATVAVLFGGMAYWTTSFSSTDEAANGNVAWEMGDEWAQPRAADDEQGAGDGWDGDDDDDDDAWEGEAEWDIDIAEGVPMEEVETDDSAGGGDIWGGYHEAEPPTAKDTTHTSDKQTAPGDDRVAPTRTREFFPETWLWRPLLFTDEDGEAELELTAPDSITNWKVEAVAHTKDARIGIGNANVTVFQKFFLEPDLPEHVIRNDSFTMRVSVYNYADGEKDCTVELEEADWFELEDDGIKTVTVPQDTVLNVTFRIRALDVGYNDVTIVGDNGEVADKVIKPLRVEPDGRETPLVLNGKLTDNDTSGELTVDFSAERIPNSEDAWVKLQGGMEAVLLDGAEGYIHFVSGCGEQSMSTLSVDILAFDTVAQLDNVAAEKLFEYETIVTQGIEHELQYLLESTSGPGRGIAWWVDDQDAHPWLTAWGLLTFQDALDAGFALDETIISDMQTFLASTQNDDGSFTFPEWGLYEYTPSTVRNKVVATTSYIARSLIYSGYTDSTVISRAMDHIADHALEDTDDPYIMALCLLALAEGGGDTSVRNQLADHIHELRTEDNGTVCWNSKTNMLHDSDYGYYGGGGANAIETTGYCMMALHAQGKYTEDVQGAVTYLMENRGNLGGWYSTQDTIVAFWALKKVGTINMEEVTVEVVVSGEVVATELFNQSTKDVTRLIDLRPHLAMDNGKDVSSTVEVTTTGKGMIFYQVFAEEYLPWPDERPPDEPIFLDITYDATEVEVDDMITATVNLRVNLDAGMNDTSNMTSEFVRMILIDVRAPVGFSFVEEDFLALHDEGTIDNYEVGDRQAYFYLVDVPDGADITFSYRLRADMPIRGTIQEQSAEDMYNPDNRSELPPIEVEAQ